MFSRPPSLRIRNRYGRPGPDSLATRRSEARRAVFGAPSGSVNLSSVVREKTVEATSVPVTEPLADQIAVTEAEMELMGRRLECMRLR